MSFSEVASNLHTGRHDNFCDMDTPPDWLGELQEHVEKEVGHYDYFTGSFLVRSIKRIDAYLQNNKSVRMPPLQSKNYDDGRLKKWLDSRDRSEYIRKGEYGYYDRLEMEYEEDVKKAKQVGAQIEHREVFEAAYNFLVDSDIIEVVEPEKERSHSSLTDNEGWLDLQVVWQGEEDEAIYEALIQLHNTYTDGEFVHDRKPVQLTDPEVAPEQERTALNLEVAFNLSLLSMSKGVVNFQNNFQCEEKDGMLLIRDFGDASLPDAALGIKNGKGYILGETTGLATDREIRENELPKIANHAERFAEEHDVPEEELIIYFVTALSLNEESMTWRRAFQTHHQYGPSIVPNDIEGHADLFAHFKELDGHSLEQFQTFLKGLSFSAENHDILRDAPNTIEWLNQTVDEAYRQVNDGEVEDIHDIKVTISTRYDSDVTWPLITDGKTLQPLVDELNELDELMGTGNQPFELDDNLQWDEAVNDLYEQIKDFYYGISELLGHDRRNLQSIKEGLKLPFVMGELRELKEEWSKQTNEKHLSDIVDQLNEAISDLEGLSEIKLEKGVHSAIHRTIREELVGGLVASGLISVEQMKALNDKKANISNLEELLGFAKESLSEAEIATKCRERQDNVVES